MVPAQSAASSIGDIGAEEFGSVAARHVSRGRSVTSIAIMSMETRPMIGQRLPPRKTCGGSLRLPELKARGTPSL